MPKKKEFGLKNNDTPLPKPVMVAVQAGKVYHWCQCGGSGNLPFCDRKDCGDQCVNYQSPYDDTVFFCNCRQTQDPPLCDGSHAGLLLALAKQRENKTE